MLEVRIYEVRNAFRLCLYSWYGYFSDDCVSFLTLWFLFFTNVDNSFLVKYIWVWLYMYNDTTVFVIFREICGVEMLHITYVHLQ